MNHQTKIYGFVLAHSHPEGYLRYLPPGCTHVLVYSDDARIFADVPVGNHLSHGSDFHHNGLMSGWCNLFDKVSQMGKYKLDIAVRLQFPRYQNVKMITKEVQSEYEKDMADPVLA